jgi:hypothetical protein
MLKSSKEINNKIIAFLNVQRTFCNLGSKNDADVDNVIANNRFGNNVTGEAKYEIMRLSCFNTIFNVLIYNIFICVLTEPFSCVLVVCKCRN